MELGSLVLWSSAQEHAANNLHTSHQEIEHVCKVRSSELKEKMEWEKTKNREKVVAGSPLLAVSGNGQIAK
jgi:hypothetical protein